MYSGFGRLIRASFDTAEPACARDPKTNKLKLNAQIVVGDAKGRLSGPYKLARPKACNKTPFATTKTSTRKAQRR